ncbi:MAG: ATP-binding protein [Desulfobacteraceae bacterium]|jgi:MinD superfamily P-loop ATPase
MPEILIISGKGGTGKTSLTAAFAHLADNAIICDLDVDAPDLHLLLQPDTQQTHEFYSGYEAVIQPELCDGCDTCRQMCRYDAVKPGTPAPVIDPLKCEGCKVCVEFCPADAIAFTSKHCGNWFDSDTRFGPMVHAQLFPGEENSGRLVAVLRQRAKEMAQARAQPLILSDGPPGIGCPVISSLSGVNLAVIVTEPTPSGLHDLERIVSLCDHFKIPVAVIINKYDLNEKMTQVIEAFCGGRDDSVVAKLPHDPVFVHAMLEGRAVTEYANGNISQRIRRAWDHILALSIACSGPKVMAS